MSQEQIKSAATKDSQKQGCESHAKTPTVQLVSLRRLRNNPRNARTHSQAQIAQIVASIQSAGFINPIIADEKYVILAGHGRFFAAKVLKLLRVPVIVRAGLSDEQKRTYVLADNKIPANAGWDLKDLALEISDLAPRLETAGLDFELVTGFGAAECDRLLTDFVDPEREPSDQIPELASEAVSQAGDVWTFGNHRLLCGDARDPGAFLALMCGENAAVAFLDAPYNVKVSSIGGRGATKHREFAAASGEMTSAQFTSFLTETHKLVARHCADGALVYSCMDFRHMSEMLTAGAAAFSELKNLVVWVKSNAGQGSFYRSQHELIFVFRVGRLPHRNNVRLGSNGRNRSNVWTYAGVNSFRAGRMDELSVHPTVKPVALVADAMRDCTRRGDIVLDSFCGSGTTILAAERVGRRGYGIELDPLYVDVAIRRWQDFTKRDAILSGTRKTFREIEKARSPSGKRRRA